MIARGHKTYFFLRESGHQKPTQKSYAADRVTFINLAIIVQQGAEPPPAPLNDYDLADCSLFESDLV